MTAKPKCPGCGHAAHRDGCRAKAPYGCVSTVSPADGAPAGFACYRGVRAPCPCPLGWCHTCRAVIQGASPLPLGDVEIDLDYDLAGVAGGGLAVRALADGTLACRVLAAGEEPAAGEIRGRAHAHQLPEAAAWLAGAAAPGGQAGLWHN